MIKIFYDNPFDTGLFKRKNMEYQKKISTVSQNRQIDNLLYTDSLYK